MVEIRAAVASLCPLRITGLLIQKMKGISASVNLTRHFCQGSTSAVRTSWDETAQRLDVEKLWREFFQDPSQWWDHRPEKGNVKYPDFKHKVTQQGLWLSGKLNPHWVGMEMAVLAPGAVESNVFSWNRRLTRAVKDEQYEGTMELYVQMQQESINPDKYTFVPVLNACASLQALDRGKLIHTHIIQCGVETDLFVCNSLIDMYTKCGSIDDAVNVFKTMPTRTVVSWNSMILGHVKCGQGLKALELCHQMRVGKVEPDHVTFVAELKASASILALDKGRHVHEEIIQRGCSSNIAVCNSLVDMYAKCGSIEDAWRVFAGMSRRTVVSWSAMIQGFMNLGQGQEALKMYHQMQQEGVDADPVTFVGVLNACASVGALQQGRNVHKQIIQSGWKSDLFMGNSLIDMYAKCGSVEDALAVFTQMPNRDVVSWTAMIQGYAMHGQAEEALKLFQEMHEEDVRMDGVTLVSVLTACSHGGLVNEGLHCFESMNSVYSLSPTPEHYLCVVDLLGRAGRLGEAEDLIKTIPFGETAAVWMSLHGACKIHGNAEKGELAARRALELDPQNAAAYLLLSNTYAAAGKWVDCAAVKQERLENCTKTRNH